MTSEKLKQSLEQGRHAQLKRMVGTWRGTSKVWFGPDEPHDVSPAEGTVKAMMDGRFIEHTYTSQFEGKSTQGTFVFGYNQATDKWQSTWIDSFHMGTGILFSEGTGDAFSATGYYPAGDQLWGWRTALSMPSENELVITAYNIEPGAEEALAMEIRYNRISRG